MKDLGKPLVLLAQFCRETSTKNQNSVFSSSERFHTCRASAGHTFMYGARPSKSTSLQAGCVLHLLGKTQRGVSFACAESQAILSAAEFMQPRFPWILVPRLPLHALLFLSSYSSDAALFPVPTRSPGTSAHSVLPPFPTLASRGVKDRHALHCFFGRPLILFFQLYPDADSFCCFLLERNLIAL